MAAPLLDSIDIENKDITADALHTQWKFARYIVEDWTTSELNGYLSFPHVGQAFAIERKFVDKQTGKVSKDIAYGITSRKKEEANAERILKVNRGHWTIENCCHYILDWNYDEDRSRIRTGYGPESRD